MDRCRDKQQRGDTHPGASVVVTTGFFHIGARPSVLNNKAFVIGASHTVPLASTDSCLGIPCMQASRRQVQMPSFPAHHSRGVSFHHHVQQLAAMFSADDYCTTLHLKASA